MIFFSKDGYDYESRIDYIFTKMLNGIIVKKGTYKVLRDLLESGNYISDHFPVLVSFEIDY